MIIGSVNQKYSFDTLIVGVGNQFAHAASLAVVDMPSKTYNPLYVHGDIGVGKTHLLQAIAHSIAQRNSKLSIVYKSLDSFMNELLGDIRRDVVREFRERYRNTDVLLVDDIQYLAGKQKTQEEFVDLFDFLYSLNKQIVIAGNCSPREIPAIEKSIRERFEWGLIADIQPFDLQTRIAFIKNKAVLERVEIPDDVVLFIAERIKSADVRRLEGALARLIAYGSLRNLPFSASLAEEVLGYFFNREDEEFYGRRIYLVDAFPQIIDILRKDYSYIHQLSPDQFELLICDRLSKMGYEVERVGSIYSPDGGVDIIAWPNKPTPFPYLLATQVKHHKLPSKKTGPSAVKDLQAVIASQPFQAGILVTNTTFTPNAQWFAKHRSHIVRLRDMHDLKRWICDNFTDESEWREIPSDIELAPGINVKLPRP